MLLVVRASGPALGRTMILLGATPQPPQGLTAPLGLASSRTLGQLSPFLSASSDAELGNARIGATLMRDEMSNFRWSAHICISILH